MRYDNRNFNLLPGFTLNTLLHPENFLSFSADDCQLIASRIDIWQFTLSPFLKETSFFLNNEENTRANRFHFIRHKHRFTMCRAFLRLILARYLQLNPKKIDVRYAQYGKPEVERDSIQFNVSHSGELCLIAVGRVHALGIDIENFSDRPYVGIAKDLFSELEYQQLLAAPEPLKKPLFFSIWSQKEAFIKAVGMGLSYPTQQFSVPLYSKSASCVSDSLSEQTWQLLAFAPHQECAAALCFNKEILEIRKLILDEPLLQAIIDESL